MALVQSISVIPATTTVVASALDGLCSTAEVPSGIRLAECTCSGSTDRSWRKRAWSERREIQSSQKSDWVGENSSPQVVSVAGARGVWAGKREEVAASAFKYRLKQTEQSQPGKPQETRIYSSLSFD